MKDMVVKGEIKGFREFPFSLDPLLRGSNVCVFFQKALSIFGEIIRGQVTLPLVSSF